MLSIRNIVAAALAIASFATAAAAQVTEQDAVTRALSRTAVAETEAGLRDAARAAVSRESVWSNPSLSYLEEPGDGDDETTLALTQSIDLGGRGLRTSAARTRSAATESEIATLRLDISREARLAFHELLAAQRESAALERWGERIARGAATIATLREGGEVSGYDSRRAQRERLSVEARLRTARARLAAARERLATLTGAAPEELTARGVLLPAPPPELDSLLASLESRPDIRAEALRADAAALERRAASRWWIPSADLTAGEKSFGDASLDGAVLGVAIGIPLFDRRQSASLEATADERATRARHELLLARAAGDVRARAAEATELRESAVAFRESAASSSEELVEIASVAYRAGEVGILELLDAYRSAVDADTDLIDLELRARIAAIELARAAGTDAAATSAMENER